VDATSVPGGAAPASQPAPSDRRRWLILGLIGLAQLMIVLDVTIMNIALPFSAARPAFFQR
jgi:hypothetical protein